MYTNPNMSFLFTAEYYPGLCCKVTILSSYNVSIMFLGCLYYSIISGYNVTMMLQANEASVFFNQSYLNKEYA